MKIRMAARQLQRKLYAAGKSSLEGGRYQCIIRVLLAWLPQRGKEQKRHQRQTQNLGAIDANKSSPSAHNQPHSLISPKEKKQLRTYMPLNRLDILSPVTSLKLGQTIVVGCCCATDRALKEQNRIE